MNYIFDLDNTLVYTNQANNDAYNAALRREHLAPIQWEGRIVRSVVREVYPQLTDDQLQRIIRSKQACYPFERTQVNAPLLRYVKALGRERCFLWSGADQGRARSLMDYHHLNGLFSAAEFSEKTDVLREFDALVRRFSLDPRDLTVFEDTDRHIEALRSAGISVVDVKSWSPEVPPVSP